MQGERKYRPTYCPNTKIRGRQHVCSHPTDGGSFDTKGELPCTNNSDMFDACSECVFSTRTSGQGDPTKGISGKVRPRKTM